MTPKRAAEIVCAVLFISTLILVGITYRRNLNDSTGQTHSTLKELK